MSAPSRGTHFGDGLRAGPQRASQFDNGILGAPISPYFCYDIQPEPASFTNIAPLQLPTGSGYLTLVTNGNSGTNFATTLNSTPIILFDSSNLDYAIARRVQIRGVSATTLASVTLQGIDIWNNKVTEQLSGPVGATTVTSKKAFKGLFSVFVSAGTTGNISVGCADAFGMPYVAQSQNYIVPFYDGIQMNVGLPTLTAISGAMTAGAITIQNPNVKSNSLIFLSYDGTISNPGFLSAPTSGLVAGISFNIASSSATDVSTAFWEIVDPSYAAGTATLGTGGTITVTNELVTASDIIQLSYNTFSPAAGNAGRLTYTITDGSFVITSSSATDRSSVNWRIWKPSLYANNVTLAGTTTVVPSFIVNGSSRILLTYKTVTTPGTISVNPANTSANTSFTIISSSGTDASVVSYRIINTAVLGTFVLPDKTDPATINGGDPRGIYIPSYPSNGLSRLTLNTYNRGIINPFATIGAEPAEEKFRNSDENLWGVPNYSDNNT